MILESRDESLYAVGLIKKIEAYVHGFSFDSFCKNLLMQDGVIRENKLVHEYFDVDAELVWTTIAEDLPQLKRAVQ